MRFAGSSGRPVFEVQLGHLHELRRLIQSPTKTGAKFYRLTKAGRAVTSTG